MTREAYVAIEQALAYAHRRAIGDDATLGMIEHAMEALRRAFSEAQRQREEGTAR